MPVMTKYAEDKIKAITDIIDAEDKFCPIGDPEISRRLEERGFTLSPAEVHYARKMLEIPGSYRRRRQALEELKSKTKSKKRGK